MGKGPSVARRKRIFERDTYRCAYCGRELVPPGPPEQVKGVTRPDNIATLDHIVPGAGHADDNLITACSPCNEDKGTDLLLFHPMTGERTPGVTWENVWMKDYRRVLLDEGIPLERPNDFINRMLHSR